MKYIEYKINAASAEQSDIIVADLAEMGFESFSDYDTALGNIAAYITESEYAVFHDQIENYLHELPHSVREIEPENWNAIWESGFQPVDMDGMCYIRAPFHAPAQNAGYDIVIMPKMSFGTGHHPTTYLMAEAVLDLKLNLNHQVRGMRGLDMGSGTGILAILAAKCGALHVDAIDIDEWAAENCAENAALNDVTACVTPILGDASYLTRDDRAALGGGARYDFVLANINRNILLRDMPTYVSVMNDNAVIVFSGFLELDIPVIEARANEVGVTVESHTVRDGWARIVARKS